MFVIMELLLKYNSNQLLKDALCFVAAQDRTVYMQVFN